MLGVTFSGDQHSGVTQIPTCAFIKYHPGLKVERSKFVTWPVFYVVFLGKTWYSHNGCFSSLSEYKWISASYQGNLTKCFGGGGRGGVLLMCNGPCCLHAKETIRNLGIHGPVC